MQGEYWCDRDPAAGRGCHPGGNPGALVKDTDELLGFRKGTAEVEDNQKADQRLIFHQSYAP